MLQQLKLLNFKAWKNLDIHFGKVTGLFGTNSSGKSSLLQFLLLLKETKNSTDRGVVLNLGGPEKIVNLGNFKDIVFRHREKEEISWKLNWSLEKQLKISDPSSKRSDFIFEGNELSTECSVSLRKGLLASKFLRYTFGNENFEISPKKENSTEFRLLPDPKSKRIFSFKRTTGRVWNMPGPVKTHLFPDQAKTYYQNADFLSEFEREYEAFMDKIFYLGPLREYPKREYRIAGSSPIDVGIRGESTIDAIFAATNRGEERNLGPKQKIRPFQEMIAYWLKELGLIKEFRIEELKKGSNLFQAVVKKDAYSSEALLTDVGFGVSQILPAIVLLYYVPKGSTIIMEQPEIHLHPSVQSGLADIILTVSKSRNIQVIVESHSEHLLRRFQRRVAEKKVNPNQIKLFFCENINGESYLRDLQLNLWGDIEDWPENFFGDELGEIAAIKSAALKNKLRAKS